MTEPITACAEIREQLPAYVKDRGASLTVRRHLSRCKACAEELHRYEALAVGLDSLRQVWAEPPAGLLGELMSIPAQGGRIESLRSHVARRRNVYLGGAAVVVAGAALWRTHARRAA